jgi:hypothetical protein
MKYRSLLFALLLPLPARAQSGAGFGPLGWDYVAASVIVPDLDDLGFELEGSTAVTRKLVVFGGYRSFAADSRIDRTTLQIGVGHLWNARQNIEVLASVSYADNEIDLPLRSIDEEGVILAGEIRGWATARFELSGTVMLDNSVGSSTETILEFGGQFFRDRNRSLGGRIRADEDDTTLFLGARFYFGASRR